MGGKRTSPSRIPGNDLGPELIGRGLMFALGLYLCVYVIRPRLPLIRTLSRWGSAATSDPVAGACVGTVGSGLMVAAFLH